MNLKRALLQNETRILRLASAGIRLAAFVALFTAASAPAQPVVPLWTNWFSEAAGNDVATAVAVDKAGNVFVTGYGGYQPSFTTIKYSNSGVPLWTNFYNTPLLHPDDRATSLIVDGENNVVVAGYSWGTSTESYDYGVVKYSNSGQLLWTNSYDGPGKQEDHATALTVDSNNNVFVTGFSPRSSFFPYNNDFATLKYSSNGVALWTNRYNGPGNGDDNAVAIAAGPNGDIYVTGYSANTGSQFGFATLKYSNAGAALWTNRFGIGRPAGIVVDTNGNGYVTGFAWNGSNSDFVTIAYSSSGAAIWTNWFTGTGNGSDYGSAIGLDAAGNITAAGYVYTSNSNYDIVTVQYTSAGVPLWTNTFDNGLDDFAYALAVDARGNVFVTGDCYNTNGSLDQVTLAYSATGVPLWTNVYNGPGNGVDVGNAVATDNHGNAFVAGYSDPGDISRQFITTKFGPIVSLAIEGTANGLVLTWPDLNYTLQCAPSLSDAFTNISGATSPYTNSVLGSQQFFRLIAN